MWRECKWIEWNCNIHFSDLFCLIKQYVRLIRICLDTLSSYISLDVFWIRFRKGWNNYIYLSDIKVDTIKITPVGEGKPWVIWPIECNRLIKTFGKKYSYQPIMIQLTRDCRANIVLRRECHQNTREMHYAGCFFVFIPLDARICAKHESA